MEWNRPKIEIPEDLKSVLKGDISPPVGDAVVPVGDIVGHTETEIPMEPPAVPDPSPKPSPAPEPEPEPPRLPPNSPWAVCADPPPETRSTRYLYQLLVDKNRKWTISLIDTNTGNRRNHASGSGGILKMNKQVYSGDEFARRRGLSV